MGALLLSGSVSSYPTRSERQDKNNTIPLSQVTWESVDREASQPPGQAVSWKDQLESVAGGISGTTELSRDQQSRGVTALLG